MKKYPCPCCSYLTLVDEPPGTYQICPVCFWEDDPLQFIDQEYGGGANNISLAVAQQNFLQFGAISKDLLGKVRPPHADEIPSL